MRPSRGVLLSIVLLGSLHHGCFSIGGNGGGCDARSVTLVDDGGCVSCGLGCPSPASPTKGPVHGKRPDGRVDVSAAEAWPDRPPAEPVPAAEDVARACAAFAGCKREGFTEHVCVGGAVAPFTVNAAERVIPITGAAESWSTFVRGVLDAQGDCAGIGRVLTERDPTLDCQEDGCWSTAQRKVSCDGDVAVMKGSRRDCSRAGMHCSETSPTGCTDRPLVRCTSGGMDRCDGDIKLGCDGCGFVSFHDCTWNGGHCSETPGGAECVPPLGSHACDSTTWGCTGSVHSLCVGEQLVDVDCKAIGFQGCAEKQFDSSPIGGCTCVGSPSCPCATSLCTQGSPEGGTSPGAATPTP